MGTTERLEILNTYFGLAKIKLLWPKHYELDDFVAPKDMKVFLDKSYYENIENTGKVASIGTFDKYYRSSRNFIADLEHLGPVLVSISRDQDITRALIRSVLGFMEYKYHNRHIAGCPYFFSIKNSLSLYFSDTVADWSYSEAIGIDKGTRSIFGMLSSIFTFGGSWSLGSDSVVAKKNMYDSITTEMMKDRDAFLVDEIMSKMAEIGSEYAGELDREFNRKPMYVDIVGDVHKIPFGLLGRKIANGKDEDFSISDAEVDRLVIGSKSGERRLRNALIGFVFNELEYFSQLNEFYHESVLRFGDNETVFGVLFCGFAEVYEFEIRFLRSMDMIVQGLGLDLDQVIRDPTYFKSSAEDVDVDAVGLGDREMVSKIFAAFEDNFFGLECYKKLMLSYEESLEAWERYKDGGFSTEELPSISDVRDCFYNCLQRIVRYPILIKDILKNVQEDGVDLRSGKIVYLKIVRLINVIDRKKEEHDNNRCAKRIREKMSGLPNSVLWSELKFIDQLDCEDLCEEAVTLFLLSDMLVVAGRGGPPVSISDLNAGRYVFKCVFRLENVEVVVFGRSGLKVIVKNAECGLYQMEEVHGDISIGVLYFMGCSSSPRNRFIEEFCKAKAPPGGDQHMSFGSLFFRTLVSSCDVDESRELVIYTDLQEFLSSSGMFVGYLDLNGLDFRLRDDMNFEYGLRTKQCADVFAEKFPEHVFNALQFRRASLASRSTLKDRPELFARYKMCLREIVEKHGDSVVVEFNERLSREDLMTTTQKISKAKTMIGYISRSMSCASGMYYANDLCHKDTHDPNMIIDGSMKRLYTRLLESRQIEDSVFDGHKIEDVLCLLMYFVRTNLYSFLSLDDISAINKTLFVDKTYDLKVVVSGLRNASSSFVSSLFDLVIMLRDKIDISSVLEAMLVIFVDKPCVSKSEISSALFRIHW